MKYQKQINSIKKSIEKNKLQEAVEKMYSLSYKTEDEIDVFNCICGKLVTSDMIKMFLDSGHSIDQYDGDVFSIENLNEDTYYNIIWNNEEIIIFNLTKGSLYDTIAEIDYVVYDKFLDKVIDSENVIIKFLNKNIEILKNELSEKYKRINKNFENKFGLNFEEYCNWICDSDNEEIIKMVQ